MVGEARAALEGVRLAHEKGWRDIILESDCAQIISAIQNQVHDPQLPYGFQLVSEVLSFCSSFDVFSCTFVRRSGNKPAHALAYLPIGSSDSLEAPNLPADLALII